MSYFITADFTPFHIIPIALLNVFLVSWNSAPVPAQRYALMLSLSLYINVILYYAALNDVSHNVY